MVAYNFSPEFAADVAARRKRQTLRRHPRAKVGDFIQLYTGQRTPKCRKLVDEDPVCMRTAVVHLLPEGIMFDGHWQAKDAVEGYARLDGFPNYAAMYEWFKRKYGEVPQPLYETRWDWPAPGTTK